MFKLDDLIEAIQIVEARVLGSVILDYHDGKSKKRMTFSNLDSARKFAHKKLGTIPAIGKGYAEGDKLDRITCVSGCSIKDIFPSGYFGSRYPND